MPSESGLKRLLKLYGTMKVGDVTWYWDYENDVAVTESDMPKTSERFKASEKAKWTKLMDKFPGI